MGIFMTAMMPKVKTMPSARPAAPPKTVTTMASMRNWTKTCQPVAPSALRTPTSRIRSVNEASMILVMTIPPTSNEMTPQARNVML